MTRPVLIATSVAVTVVVVVLLVASGSLDAPQRDPGGAREDGSVADDGAKGPSSDPGGAVVGVSGAADAVVAATGDGAEGRSADAPPPQAGDGPDDDEIRERAELAKALREAVEAGDPGVLEDFLLLELTPDGTRFGPEAVPSLLASLVGIADPGVQKLALTHLERMEGVAPELLRDGYLRYLADAERPLEFRDVLDQLVEVGRDPAGSDATVAGLVGLLAGGEREPFRSEIVSALGDLGSERAVPALREALERDDGEHAQDYLDALSRIGGREATSVIVAVASVAESRDVVSAIGNLRGREVAPVLASALSVHASERYNQEALRKLGEIKDPRTIPDVSRFLDRTTSPLALEAIVSLSRYDDIRAVRSLERFAARHPDSEYRQHALSYAERARRKLAESRGEEPTSPAGGEPEGP